MRTRMLALASLLALVGGGSYDNGCFGPLRPPPDGNPPPAADGGVVCPAIACDPMCGPAGVKIDANGCMTCECNQPVGCRDDAECPAGQRCELRDCTHDCDAAGNCATVCGGRCVLEKPQRCLADSECGDGMRCNLPACAPCPPGYQCEPCYGYCEASYCTSSAECGPGRQCVTDPDCQSCPECGVCPGRCAEVSCEGAFINPRNGACTGPDDGLLPAECCRLPPCSDGSRLVCKMEKPPCAAGLVAAIRNGCYECVDPATCEPRRECFGAFINPRNGLCTGPNDGLLPPECCGLGKCDDGSQVVCEMMPPRCGAGLVPAVRNGCYQCVDSATCRPRAACVTDADCPNGTCWDGACIGDCMPVACDVYCPYGHALDARGCEQCACNPPPRCRTDAECAPGDACVAGQCRRAECPGVSCTLYCEFGFAPGPDGCPTCRCNEPPVCNADFDCPAGEQCLDGRCQRTSCPPVMCDLYCEHGFATGPDGCPTCSCNPPVCMCPEIYAPVCGADGRTYGNECEARCARTAVASRGACDCNIACVRYDPVCGTDGVTYGCGAVEAHCHGVEVAYAGECGSASCRSNADCRWGEKCLASADGVMKCVAADFCYGASDCSSLAPTQSCRGAWQCAANKCLYACQ